MTVDQQFTLLNESLQQLLKQHLRVQKENERLREELDMGKKREEELRKRADELGQQVSILKISSGEMSEKDKKEFEKKINQYIKEIDKTIAYLSQ